MYAILAQIDGEFYVLNFDLEVEYLEAKLSFGENCRDLTEEEKSLFTDGIDCAGGEGTEITGSDVNSAVISYTCKTAQSIYDEKIDLVYLAESAALNKVASPYRDEERETWTSQFDEAKNYQLDNGASTPFIDAAVAASGGAWTKPTLVSSIMANYDIWASASGNIVGQRKAHVSSLEALLDADDKCGLSNYDVSFSEPAISPEDK